MNYLLSFLEGIITFLSPCLLPMLPIYISYFMGKEKKPLVGAAGFSCGFTIAFVTLGAFAGTIGKLLLEHSTAINIICGSIMVLFGLNVMGILRIQALNNTKKLNLHIENTGFFSAMLFGIIFSIGWTPCVGVFLGSALMLAANSASVLKGVMLLLCYSLGLSIPFMVSAVLIDRLKGAFDYIKKNFKVINRISGTLLVLTGILMATGSMGYLMSLLS